MIRPWPYALVIRLVTKKEFDPKDQMNRYCNWWHYGYMSSNGTCFDIGMTVQGALQRYQVSGESYSGSDDPRSVGNGSIMRIAPIAIAFHNSGDLLREYSRQSSRTTHACTEALDACELFTALLVRATEEGSISDVFENIELSTSSEGLKNIASGQFLSRNYKDIRGSGYVVESLEAALWCFANSDSFKDALILAINLGDDADTTGAVCGQIASAYYGLQGIPHEWSSAIVYRNEIQELADDLYELGKQKI